MSKTVNVTRLLSLTNPSLKFKCTFINVLVETKFGSWLTALEEHFDREQNLVPTNKMKFVKQKGLFVIIKLMLIWP